MDAEKHDAPRDDLWDALPDGVIVADAAGRIIAVNEGARTLLGTSATLGSDLADLALRDQEGGSWFARVQPLQGLPSRRGVPEQSWLTDRGHEVLVTVRLSRRPGDRSVDRIGMVIRSGRGRARLDRERSDLVATVAHELRSPLTGVKGFVTTLLNKWDRLNDEQKQLMLTTVATDADRLSRLIGELLDVARIDTGRLPLYPRQFDAAPLLERAVASARAATHRSITIVGAPAELLVFADPDKVVQIVTNLLDNALRHGAGDVRLEASTDGSQVRIGIEDDGEGISPELRRLVFTKFWKYGRAAGSGLGLYLVAGLARAHGGSVAIADAASGGARIEVSLPVDDPRP